MNRVRLVLGLDKSVSNDEGFTLVEVIVAMLVFAIISLAVAMSIGNGLVITHDSRSRTVAENLASQDLDLERAISNVFSVQSKTWTTTIQGTTYTITRAVNWVSSSTATSACGSGTGTLQYKTVTDTVTYPGAGTSNPVVSSTDLAPNSRINDPTLGTIIISVKGASGAGAAGVSVTIAPAATNANGAVAVAAPAATDANGCTYALEVTPGNYTVTISRTSGIDYTQNASPSTTLPVVAGTATTYPFTYDTAENLTLKYASNYTATPAPTLPTNLDTTFNSTTGGIYTKKLASTSPTVALFPFTGGYTYESGAYVSPLVSPSCVNVDPGSWTTPNSSSQVGASFINGTGPGQSLSINVPMGVVALPASSGVGGIQATAVNTTANGDPGCGSGVVYTFTSLASTPLLALPFGTWRITTLAAVLITPTAGSIKTGGVINSNGTVTLDPRGVTP